NNNHILSQRDSIINISKKKNISKAEKEWLDNIYKTYRCKPYNTNELLINVDIIPPSLAIAQAIVESGWGTSKFAIEGNSLFGEHFSNGASGDYISASGSDIKLKAFPSIYGAVKSYSININRHRAYRKFRAKRFEMRNNNIDLNSIELIETLGSYSELGDEYILYIKNIINKNSLQKFDNLKLSHTDSNYYINILE
ncbi:MAG: glucosaminidase domain-containing protein, partial [Chlamydiia bacterium]|nr:glucosaminidase domain-containing protein [Chlamydiia bacterium]